MASEAQPGGLDNWGTFRPRLRDGIHEYVLVGFHEPLPEGHELVVLGDRWQAERRVRELAQDYFNLRTLCELVHTHAFTTAYEPLSEELVLRQAVMLLANRHFRLARVPPPVVPGLMPRHERLKSQPPPPPVEEDLRLMLQVIDDLTEAPIADIKLSIKLSDGSQQQATTDSEGRISLSGIPKGRVDVTSELEGATLAETLAFVKSGILPSLQSEGKSRRRRRRAASGKFLARVTEHKVSDGETLESIAQAYELTVDQLTQFNWGTTDPDEIQQRLFVDVGCTSRDESDKFVLSRYDDPGIIYIPRPLELKWVALEERHLLRVKRVPGPRLYQFSV